MSVVIKGMEMPNACCHCPGSDSAGCAVTGRVMTTEEMAGMLENIGDCPAHPLPEKHGRLIDADALIRDHFSPEHRIALSEANKAWMRKIINDAPTIVEAGSEGR